MRKIEYNNFELNSEHHYNDTDMLLNDLRQQSIGILITENILKKIDSLLIPVLKEGKIGFIDKYGTMRIQPQFDNIKGSFVNKNSLVCVSCNEKWGVLDSAGNMQLDCLYDDVFLFRNQYVIIFDKLKSSYKMIELENKTEVIPEGKYEFIHPVNSKTKAEYLEVRYSVHKRGIIDGDGKVIVPIEYKWVSGYEYGGVFRVIKKQSDGKELWGLYHKSGEMLLQPVYSNISKVKYPENPIIICVDLDGIPHKTQIDSLLN